MKFKDCIKGIVFAPWGRIYGSLTPVRPVPTIDSLLTRANGSRRVRTLDPATIDRLIRRCRDAAEGHWSYDDGGLVANAYGWIARSTFAFAAKIEGDVYVGITSINAKTQGTPGAGWSELRNFTSSGPPRQAEKLRSWRDENLNQTVIWVRPE